MNAVYLILLLAFSAFFSMSEIALASLNRFRLSSLAEDGKRTAVMAEKLKEAQTSALSTILVGNNLVNIASSSLSTMIALSLMPHNEALGGTIATLLITVVTLIFGEIVPKLIGKRWSIPVSRVIAYPLRFLTFVFLPITYPVGLLVGAVSRLWKKDEDDPTVTEEELATIIDTVEEEGVIDEDKSELLQSALDFSDRTVGDILTPRVDLIAINMEEKIDEVWRVIRESGYSRYPVYRESVDHIVGILHTSSLLKDIAENGFDAVRLADHVKDTAFVHKTMRLPDAFNKMKEMQCHMLVVIDEYGGTHGVVTMETVIEDIVGDIWDEDETVEREVRPIGENEYEVLGQTNIEDFFDEIDFEDRDFESEYTTVSGWTFETLGEEIRVGSQFVYKNLKITVTELGENVIEKLRVQVLLPSDEDE